MCPRGLRRAAFCGAAGAHQDTVAHSRMVIQAKGDVEYALKIPVEDLAEALGRRDHAALNAPEVRAREGPAFRHFQPLVGMSSGGEPCPVEQSGIDVPEDERLYGELRFVFHCPAGAPITIDYRVFFDIDPGHVGVLEVESEGGKTRAEIIRERPRWEIHTAGDGPPRVRPVEGTAVPPTEKARPIASAKPISAEPTRSAEEAARAVEAGRAELERRKALEKARRRTATGCSSRSSPRRRWSGRLSRDASGAAPHLTSPTLNPPLLRAAISARRTRKRPFKQRPPLRRPRHQLVSNHTPGITPGSALALVDDDGFPE